jgi:endogenous inhibitor of DNA gyrase (YacG/DUF329 family)
MMQDSKNAGAACPICKKAARSRKENPAFPFCCARCKQVDLGNWFDESYRVPAEEAPLDSGEGEPS